ncbi:hypothetical protein HII36_01965 [Nonomuraea sp. NN258]|nr:hypothetical protein [Nonomuraea antri]
MLAAQQATADVEACQREVKRLKTKRKRLLDLYTDPDGGVGEEDDKEQEAEIDANLTAADEALRATKAAAAAVGTDYGAIFTTLPDLCAAAVERAPCPPGVIRSIGDGRGHDGQ